MAGSVAQGEGTSSASVTTSQADPSVQETGVPDIDKASSKSGTAVEGSTKQEKNPSDVNKEAGPVQELPADLVDWDGDADPHKPMNWSNLRKFKNIIVICYLTFLTSVIRIGLSRMVQ